MEIDKIAKGYFNLLLDQLNLLDEKDRLLSSERLKICETCSVRTGDWCDSSKRGINDFGFVFTGCGCNLKAKSTLRFYEGICPGNKWKK
jgi:hypothetical protein